MFFTAATAVCALVAARYWYLSSRPNPIFFPEPVASIDDNPAEHILGAQANIDSIYAVLVEASRLNKLASIWSAWAAALGAVAAAISMM